jgi:hypothetical protein
MSTPLPAPLGLRKSFGFGDRLGLATPGHLAASNKFDFAPIFAQQSIREMERTRRTPEEVMTAAQSALTQAGFDGSWGADADHLKTPADVDRTQAAGFCFFTIDPSAFVVNEADRMDAAALRAAAATLVADGVFEDAGWTGAYLGQSFDVGAGAPLVFDEESLLRAAAKYARAIAHCTDMARHIATVNGSKPYEIEVSVDETDAPTSPIEHLFFGLELRRRGVKVVSLAPRFIGEFEKGIDYKGDLAAFEAALKLHVAVARFCGPYKISIHSGSDKFSIYPAIGRVCGDLLHVKTAGTSYLEALRVVLRTDPALFREIAAYSAGRFDTDRASYHISATSEGVTALAKNPPADLEQAYLGEVLGRQLLHVTFGSVLTVGVDSRGRTFKEGILDLLQRHADLHAEVLASHFEHHLALLCKG